MMYLHSMWVHLIILSILRRSTLFQFIIAFGRDFEILSRVPKAPFDTHESTNPRDIVF